MATCGHCKATGQTVAHVRSCASDGPDLSPVTETEREIYRRAVQTLPAPDPQPGNAVTLRNADGYWLVQHRVGARGLAVEEIRRGSQRGAYASVLVSDVEILFPDVNAAADYRIAQDQAAERARVHNILHGDWPSAQREIYYNSQFETRGELPSDEMPPVVQSRTSAEERANTDGTWSEVNKLRNAIKPHLHRKVRNAMVGHFAYRTGGVVKFYRVKKVTGGNWAGKVFVDAQASDALYPVKAPDTLAKVLTAILLDPQAAATLYGTELGQCYRCNRTLTDETSRALGIGPECRSK